MCAPSRWADILDLSPFSAVPFPGIAEWRTGTPADAQGTPAEKDHALAYIVAGQRMTAATRRPGIGNLCPFRAIPTPRVGKGEMNRVFLLVGSESAAEQEHTAGGRVERHCQASSGGWSDICHLCPESAVPTPRVSERRSARIAAK